MSDFHTEHDHKAFALLFDSHKIQDGFEKKTSLPYKVIRDKEENRFSAMLTSVGELGASFNQHQKSAIACVAIAKSEDEYIALSLGLMSVTPQGIAVCMGCLAKAIATCEENLAVLKDIQEATKSYATQF